MSRAPASHKLDVWPGTVWCASTKRQLRKIGKILDIAEGLSDTSTAGRSWHHIGPNGFHLIVWVDVKRSASPLDLVDTCAHEASHCADGLFEYVEEERPGTEVRAYFVGWMTAWLLKHCDPPS